MWTARTYQLGWAGLIVGSLTLVAAGMAAKYARDAAIHTKRSADSSDEMARLSREATSAAVSAARAGRRQVTVSQDAAERQLRAYVNMTTARISQMTPGEKIVAKIEIKNTGQTPARNTTVRWGVYSADWTGDTKPPPFPEDIRMSKGDIATGGTRELVLQSKGPIRGELIDKLHDGTAFILFFAEVEYADVFGKSHTTRINVMCGGDFGVPGGSLTDAPQGNSSD